MWAECGGLRSTDSVLARFEVRRRQRLDEVLIGAVTAAATAAAAAAAEGQQPQQLVHAAPPPHPQPPTGLRAKRQQHKTAKRQQQQNGKNTTKPRTFISILPVSRFSGRTYRRRSSARTAGSVRSCQASVAPSRSCSVTWPLPVLRHPGLELGTSACMGIATGLVV